MGRRKIVIAPITSERNRSVTYVKRKAGLFKKAHELAILTDASIAVIVFGHNGKLSEFCSGDIDRLLLRYTEYNGPVERKGPDSFGGDEDDEDEDDAEGGAAGATGDNSSSTAGPSNQRGNGGRSSNGSHSGAVAAHPGSNFSSGMKMEADQSQWEDLNPSSSKVKSSTRTTSGSSRNSRSSSPDKPPSNLKTPRSSRRISGRKLGEKGYAEDESQASDSDVEDQDGDESANIKLEDDVSADQPPLFTGKQYTKYFQPRLEGEHREGRDALKAAISTRGTAKGAGATISKELDPPASLNSESRSSRPRKESSEVVSSHPHPQHQHQHQQSHLRHLSEGSNSQQFLHQNTSSTSAATPHRHMHLSSSFSGPFGFTSSSTSSNSSPAPPYPGVSPDLHTAGLTSQMRPFTAHGTGIGMAASASGQYQHMMGGANSGVVPTAHLHPSSASSYAYLQSGGGYEGLSGSPSSRPITAHGTGQTVHYSPSPSPFPTSMAHPQSSSQGQPRSTSYSDLSGPLGPIPPSFHHQNQLPPSNYGAGNVVPSSNYHSQNQYPNGRPVSQGGIPQSQSLPSIGPFPLAHPVLMQHPQYPDYIRNLQAQQQQQQHQQMQSQGRSQTFPNQSQASQQSRPGSRNGPMSASEDASPFSHASATVGAQQGHNNHLIATSRSSSLGGSGLNVASNGQSTSVGHDGTTLGNAEERKASSGNSLAGQKRKSFELDDITLGALASSSDLSMSNFRYDLSSASADLGHSSKLARPNTSGGEMATGFSQGHSSMFETSNGLIGGLVGGTGTDSNDRINSSHSTSSMTRPSTSGHASSSSSIGSFSSHGQMPGLSLSSNTSDAGGDSSIGRSSSISIQTSAAEGPGSANGNVSGNGSQISNGRTREESHNSKAFNDLVGSFLEPGTPLSNNDSPVKSNLALANGSPNFSIHSSNLPQNSIVNQSSLSNSSGLKLNRHLDLLSGNSNNQPLSFDETGLTSLGTD